MAGIGAGLGASNEETVAILSLPPEMQKMALESRITAKIAIRRAMERVVFERYFKGESLNQKSAKSSSGE